MASYLLLRAHHALMSALTPDTAPAAPAPRRTIRIGSRKSKLALIQTELVRSLLVAAHPHLDFEIVSMTTTGDNNQTKPLHSFGAKALWTHELEELLLDGRVDMIVHSLKDMPTQLPLHCTIGAILPREDPRDALVMKASSPHTTLASLPAGSTIGTSSVRRSAQLARSHPHLTFQDVRGNVGTRLAKLDDPSSPYAALILASAGLIRLGLSDRITAPLESPVLLHAVGQGALGVEVREGDQEVDVLLAPLRDVKTALACRAERSLMRTLEGGCSVPIGVETAWEGGVLKMKGIVVSLDGAEAVDFDGEMEVTEEEEAEEMGRVVARGLVEKGAEEILKKINLNREIVDA
ncbi:uncharacterized protein LAJ45_07555 [Morchella importuna]|nr:uncharacterized protein LAJ45_07555 [Morchella importuna]KAH8148453.1 hypothetical protein LAJ45_07555 [Morchella importuna]